MKVQAVILDWAGTVVDFGSCAPVAAVERVFARFGVEITSAEARQPMGLLKRDHIAAILAMPRVAEAWSLHHGASPTTADIDRIYQDFTPLQVLEIPNHAELIPGVLSAVDFLRRRGLRIGTTTGYTRPMLQPLAEKAAAQGYRPDATVTPDEVGVGRPAPFMILENLVRLQAWPPAAVVKVGDTPVDIEEGRNAGVWTVAVAATGNELALSRQEFEALSAPDRELRVQAARERLRAAGAHWVVDTLDELPGVMDAIDALPETAVP